LNSGQFYHSKWKDSDDCPEVGIWETVRLFSTFAFAVGPTEAYYDVQSSYHR
jgi:hypothetical protein